MAEPFDFSSEEKKDLKRAQYFESLKLSPGWALLSAKMDRLVSEALGKMGAASPTIPAEDLKALHMRWQQRALMRDELLAFVETMVTMKAEILERNIHGNDPADTYDPN